MIAGVIWQQFHQRQPHIRILVHGVDLGTLGEGQRERFAACRCLGSWC
jgi:hypothetical protein